MSERDEQLVHAMAAAMAEANNASPPNVFYESARAALAAIVKTHAVVPSNEISIVVINLDEMYSSFDRCGLKTQRNNAFNLACYFRRILRNEDT